jgi:uncharacterized protein (DUF697 family)
LGYLPTDLKHTESIVANPDELRAQADTVIKYHTIIAASFGTIPVPYADLAAVAGTQVNLVRELSAIYGVPFKQEYVRTAIGAILGGGVPFAVSAAPVVSSTLKLIPFVGQVLGLAIMPGLSAATTLALGKLFRRHFEAGGNLLNLDTEELRKHFLAEYETAKQEVKTFVKGKAEPDDKTAAAAH